MIREITQLGNPVLRKVADPIAELDDPALRELRQDLLDSMKDAGGVGIAAPQIGVSLRAFVVASTPNSRYPHAPEMDPLFVINPEIIYRSEEMESDWEGCLSIPGLRGLTPRHEEIEARFHTLEEGLTQRRFSGFIARVFQHEFDHLDGNLFIDRVETSLNLMTDSELKKLLVSAPAPE